MGVKRALVCAPLMPEFDRESGSKRIYDAIAFLREAGWAVSFVAQSDQGGERYARHLQQRGVATYRGFGDRTDRLIASARFDLAIFAFWHLAEEHLPAIRRLSPDTRVIVDTIDLHFVRHARRLFQGANAGARGLLDDRYATDLCRELNTYAGADGVLAVSQKEADLVNDLVGDPALALHAPDAEDLGLSPLAFPERRGILFLGNFRHPPNKEAAQYLCREVLPRLDTRILAQHPLHIVGNAMDDEIRDYCRGHEAIRMIGWVPSVVPYLERSLLSVIPLLHGAGTKRKLIQALMVGTPTVSTAIGMEGLQLMNGQHVLQADEPQTFADSVVRLATDRDLWERLATQGRRHIEATHGREVVRDLWLRAIHAVLARKPKAAMLEERTTGAQAASRRTKIQKRMSTVDYRQLRDRIKAAAVAAIPEGSTVIVVSRGDDHLLRLERRTGWHFPQNRAGLFAGYYPSNSIIAIEHLEQLREKGGGYLLLPATALWWLDHYEQFAQHLDEHYFRTFDDEDVCVIYDLQPFGGNGRQMSSSVREPFYAAASALPRRGRGVDSGHTQPSAGEEQCLFP
jgi:glycosyltransferase involved in cell wall biosynthesis